MPDLSSTETRPTQNYQVLAGGFTVQTPEEGGGPEEGPFRQGLDLAKDLTALFSSIILSAIGYGIMVALVAFTMETHVKNEILISISSATQIGAGVLFGRFLPALGRKIGMINCIYLASMLSASSAIAMYFYVDYFLWILIIFIFGASLFMMGVTRQSIMIDLAPKHTKAMIISIGGMLVAIGNGFGPIILETIKTSNSFTSYGIAAAAYLLSMLPLSRLKRNEAKVREEKRVGIWRYIKTSPKIMFAGFVTNYSLASASAFLIIYGLKSGLPNTDAALLYSVLLFGTVFSIPLGYLTDVINRRILMILSSILAMICVTSLFFSQDPAKIHALLFLTFGCMVGIKLPAIVLINEKYKPTQRLAVNAAFAKFCLIGNIVGIFMTGMLMKIFGPSGLWISIMLILTSYLAFCALNYAKKFARGELAFARFSFGNKSKME